MDAKTYRRVTPQQLQVLVVPVTVRSSEAALVFVHPDKREPAAVVRGLADKEVAQLTSEVSTCL